jgi:hypothetical protein
MLLVLNACGQDAADTAGSTGDGGTPPSEQTPTTVRRPATIKIARAGSSGGTATTARAETAAAPAADADAPADAPATQRETGDTKLIAPIWNVEYVAADGLANVTGTRTSWFFPNDGFVVTDEQRAALAAALGVEGTWERLPADMGGGEVIGARDGTAASITIGSDALGSWWYNPDPSVWGRVSSTGCAVAEPAVDAPPPADSSAPDSSAPAPDKPVESTAPCEAVNPTPPANVPDAATAEAKARELFASVGADLSQLQFQSEANEWGAYVTAWLLLDGQKAPVTMYASYGADGVLTGAGGSLARPIQGDAYDLVGTTRAIERLNDQQGSWAALRTGGVMTADADVAVDTDAATGEGTSGSTGSGATDQAPAVPESTETQTVTLTGVTTDLTMIWDAEDTIWLLPAYSFTDSNGGVYQIIAIDDSFIEFPEVPAPAPEPLPAPDTGATGTDADPEEPAAVDQQAAERLVGLTEEEATKLAESNGWAVRVVSRDGESFPITMDYRTDRVNLTVENGVVTAVSVG